jgi:hypothetical protein
MRIALPGGTGDIGEGLALRWGVGTDHELAVGSRDAEKASRAAADYRETIAERGGDATVVGASNADATEGADVVVLSVPPDHVVATIESVADALAADAIVVSPAVAMARDGDGFHYDRPETADSVTAVAARAVPDGVAVVGAFHNLSANRLATLDAPLGVDTLVVADDEDAAATVADLAEQIEGLRAVRAGPIANAAEVEGLTPLLINVATNNDGMHHLGVRFE